MSYTPKVIHALVISNFKQMLQVNTCWSLAGFAFFQLGPSSLQLRRGSLSLSEQRMPGQNKIAAPHSFHVLLSVNAAFFPARRGCHAFFSMIRIILSFDLFLHFTNEYTVKIVFVLFTQY